MIDRYQLSTYENYGKDPFKCWRRIGESRYDYVRLRWLSYQGVVRANIEQAGMTDSLLVFCTASNGHKF